MLRRRAGRSFIALFERCGVLVFHTAVVFALVHSCRGQSEVVGPLQPVVALIGDDIVLPCHLDPVMDAFDMTVEWARPDLDPRFVLVWRDSVDLESKKHQLYDRRTSLFIQELKSGNISLKISRVKQSDEGTYLCFVPGLARDAIVQLLVGAASSPVAQINRTSSRVVLQCESAGWYPEPELLWLDGEGNLLPAGPTETLRGPDGLYNISSRVTVEEKHGNNFICRVQQKNINQHRETHIHVPDDFFMVISPSSPPSDPSIDPNTIIGLAIGAVVVLILAVSCVVWKLRQTKHKNKTKDTKTINSECVEERESEPLMTGREKETAVNITEQRTNTCPVPEEITKIKQTHEEEEELTRKEEELDIRGEQSHRDERETLHFVSEKQQIRDICSQQENMINPSFGIKKDKYTTEQKTCEEEAVTGRGVKGEGGEGEGETKMEAGKEDSGLQLSTCTEKPKEQQLLEREAFNFTDAQKNLQKNQRDEVKAEQQGEEDQRNLQSKIRKDQDKDETGLKTPKNKDKQDDMEGNKEDSTEAKKELDQDKNQLEFQPETKPETKRVQSELKRQKDKNKAAPKNQDQTEGKPKGKKGNQKRKKKLLPVSSEVPERTDLTVKEATPEENKEKEEEEKRAQPENLRGAESKKAAQEEVTEIKEGIHTDEICRKNEGKANLQQGKGGEQPWSEQQLDTNEKTMKEQLEEPVRLSEGGVTSQEESQEPMQVEENPHVDQNGMKGRKYTQRRVLRTGQQQAGRRKNFQEGHEHHGRTFKRQKESEEDNDDDVMETEGEAINQEDVPAGPQRKRGKFQPDCEQQEQMETQ